ncbi:MAG TPA: FAD-dependent monooxygenase [Pseudonocardiaceae bacterium]|jgi:2-polyprenyl-6-methoxyphenol hydroxylase-like FAD-dependent oxidoreductase|nr:FAD-dependent monooxygenase [Pseudonocardiaceae bacterium]
MGLRNRRVLISGASVAGPVLAYWLRRYGFEPTVVELAPALRDSGYPIDVRGDAVTVAERMGVLDRVRAAGLDTAGVSFVNKRGRISGSIDMRAIRKATASTDIELCRGELVRILCDTNADDVEYRFGDRITALHQDEGGVQVEFAHGAPREFDLVLGADGVHSGVRGLAFGPEQGFLHSLGCYFGGAEVDPRFGEPDRVVLRSAPDRALGVYRFRDRAAAFYIFRSETPLDHDYRDPMAPRRIFAERFTDDFWPTGLVEAVSGADATDFDSLSQIRMPAWSAGRVALAGDAAHCPTLVTGAGTSLAMVGAYRLAGELHAAAGDHERAFAAYERHYRPQVTKAQSGTAQGMNMFMPATEAAIWRRDQLLRLVPLSVLMARMTRRFARQAPELPDYPGAVSAVPSPPPPARLRTGARASGRSGRSDG